MKFLSVWVAEVVLAERRSRLGERVSRICDKASAASAYERAYGLCVNAVTMEKSSKVYVGAALSSLSEKGQFGSWLKKLFHREKVTIHLHYYERLVLIVEELAASERRRIDYVESSIRAAKGTRHAVDARNLELDRGTLEAAPQGT